MTALIFLLSAFKMVHPTFLNRICSEIWILVEEQLILRKLKEDVVLFCHLLNITSLKSSCQFIQMEINTKLVKV